MFKGIRHPYLSVIHCESYAYLSNFPLNCLALKLNVFLLSQFLHRYYHIWSNFLSAACILECSVTAHHKYDTFIVHRRRSDAFRAEGKEFNSELCGYIWLSSIYICSFAAMNSLWDGTQLFVLLQSTIWRKLVELLSS